MERIRNIYCWDCLQDWEKAQNMEIVQTVETPGSGEGIFGWEQLIHMLYENCFPQCFTCFRRNYENYLLLTKEQKKVFEFIENKIPLQERNEAQMFFSDFPAEYRNRVLSAQVESIWIRLEADENDL